MSPALLRAFQFWKRQLPLVQRGVLQAEGFTLREALIVSDPEINNKILDVALELGSLTPSEQRLFWSYAIVGRTDIFTEESLNIIREAEKFIRKLEQAPTMPEKVIAATVILREKFGMTEFLISDVASVLKALNQKTKPLNTCITQMFSKSVDPLVEELTKENESKIRFTLTDAGKYAIENLFEE